MQRSVRELLGLANESSWKPQAALKGVSSTATIRPVMMHLLILIVAHGPPYQLFTMSIPLYILFLPAPCVAAMVQSMSFQTHTCACVWSVWKLIVSGHICGAKHVLLVSALNMWIIM